MATCRYCVKTLNRLPKDVVYEALSDARCRSMRDVMRLLDLNVNSSSSSTKLKKLAEKYGVDISRFRCGVKRNLIGERFGLLTVMRPAGSRKDQQLWKCLCVCGNKIAVTTAALNARQKRHCGCHSYLTGSKSRHWRGFGELPGKLWRQILYNARRRNISVTLTGMDAWRQFIHQKRRCALTGVSLCFIGKAANASLDRRTVSSGYELGNVQWVHKTINMMKSTLDDSDFIRWAKLVARYSYEHS